MLTSILDSVEPPLAVIALGQSCTEAANTVLYYTFQMFLMATSFFDGVIEKSEKTMKDVKLMVHLMQNKNIN